MPAMPWCCTPIARAPKPRSSPAKSLARAAALRWCSPISPTATRCAGWSRRRRPSGRSRCWSTMPANSTRTDRPSRSRALRAHARRQSGRAAVAGAGFRRAGAGGRRCSIVNIVDQRVLKPTPRFFSYTLSKSALSDATVTLAQALAPAGAGQRGGAGPDAAEPAADAGAIRRARRRPCRSNAARRRRTSPRRSSIWREPKASPARSIAVDGGQHIAWRTPDSDVAE